MALPPLKEGEHYVSFAEADWSGMTFASAKPVEQQSQWWEVAPDVRGHCYVCDRRDAPGERRVKKYLYKAIVTALHICHRCTPLVIAALS